jgi:hypothetical protein
MKQFTLMVQYPIHTSGVNFFGSSIRATKLVQRQEKAAQALALARVSFPLPLLPIQALSWHIFYLVLTSHSIGYYTGNVPTLLLS